MKGVDLFFLAALIFTAPKVPNCLAPWIVVGCFVLSLLSGLIGV